MTNKYLDLIKANIFILFLKNRLNMTLLKIAYYLQKNNIHYKYDNLSNDYHRTQHKYNIYDDKDNFIHKYLFNKDIYYDKSLDPILKTTEDFCICFKKIIKRLK